MSDHGMPYGHSHRGPFVRKCPLDGSALVELNLTCPKGWGLFNPDLKLSESFCPRCDVAFLTLDDSLSPGGGIQELRWKRLGGQLTPCQPDEEGLIKLSKKMWEVHKILLIYHVMSFIYWRSRPQVNCQNDGTRTQEIGLIPYEAGFWIMLGWCPFCQVGFGQLSDPLYGWGDALKFWYDADSRSYRASLTDTDRVGLNVRRVEDRLNKLIESDQNGVPTRLTSVAGQMDIEDAPVPVAPPASLWDGWMEGFEPGFLASASARDWRRR